MIRYYKVWQNAYIVRVDLQRIDFMNADEIAALALVLQAHTPMERLSNMEVRGVLEFLRGRHYLAKPDKKADA